MRPRYHPARTCFKSLGTVLASLVLWSCATDQRTDDSRIELLIQTDEAFIGAKVPPRFVGLSFESTEIASDQWHKDLSSFARLISNLEPGVLRFGGNEVEKVSWKRRLPNCPTKVVLKPRHINSVFTFAESVDWKIIFGLNLGCRNVSNAVELAEYVVRQRGKNLLAFEIGNEPNLYVGNGRRSKDWSPLLFAEEFSLYEKRLKEKIPQALIVGPGLAGLQIATDWFTVFLEHHSSRIAFATQHTYQLLKDAEPNSSRFPSVPNLLDDAHHEDMVNRVRAYVELAAAKGLKLRIDETNSVAGGGAVGLSDVYAASLWTADHFFTLLQAGAIGADLHGSFDVKYDDSPYSPFKIEGGNVVARPPFFGLLFFSKSAKGRLLKSASRLPKNVRHYVFLDSDRSLRIVLINLSANDHAIEVEAPEDYRRGGLLRLEGASLISSEGITLGGTTINSDGTWKPQIDDPIIQQKGRFPVLVGSHSAVLITLSL